MRVEEGLIFMWGSNDFFFVRVVEMDFVVCLRADTDMVLCGHRN